MIKGGLNDTNLRNNSIGNIIKPGSTILLVGTPMDKIYRYNTQNKNKAGDDHGHKSKRYLKPIARQGSKGEIPRGIKNLGDTCSFNCVLQILYNMKAMREMILNYDENCSKRCCNTRIKFHQDFVAELHRCFKNMEHSKDIVIPEKLMNQLITCYPKECTKLDPACYPTIYKRCDLSLLLDKIFQSLILVFADRFFVEVTIGLQLSPKINEASSNTDSERKISCDSMATRLKCDFSRSDNILDCLKRTFQERDGTRIKRLPQLLTIENIKQSDNAPNKSHCAEQFCFPLRLNISELLEPTYYESKTKMTNTLQLYEAFVLDGTSTNESFNDEKKRAGYQSLFPTDLGKGENASSLYDLTSIITEVKKTGHYISYVRNQYDLDEWFQIDDEKVISMSSSVIKKCSGGTFGEQAVCLFYKGVGF